MRHKYATPGIILSRAPQAEASLTVAVLSEDFGLVRARVQGVRQPGAKLASALQTLSESELTLLHGKDGWRMLNAVLTENWFTVLSRDARARASRIAQLMLRLVQGQTNDPGLFHMFRTYIKTLPALTDEEADAAECAAALRVLSILGLYAEKLPSDELLFAQEYLDEVRANRRDIVMRINQGIIASGL
jgi:DNA repair protein RecO